MSSESDSAETLDTTVSETSADTTDATDTTTDSTTSSETGGGDAQFIPPIERDVMVDGQTQPGYVLEFTNGETTTTFECIAEKGGLVTAWKLDGVNVLLDDANPSTLDGSVFWPSPQSDWNWPPPYAIDGATYTVTVDEANMSVLLVSETDNGLNLRVEKRFTVDLEREAIILEYSMVNTGSQDRSFAPWEVSRVPPGGLTFYPTGSNAPTSGTFQPIPVTDDGDVTWFEHTPANITGQHKLFADGERGWLYNPLLSGARYLYVTSDRSPIMSGPEPGADIVAYVQKGVVLRATSCDGIWCAVRKGAIEGMIPKGAVWGVLDEEAFD